MARVFPLYASPAHIASHFGQRLPRPYDWRLVQEPFTGEVHGIPSLRGVAIATNGILLAIEQPQSKLAIVHLDTFVADAVDGVVVVRQAKKPSASKPKAYDISEFI
jgi:hypothetical protein